MQIVYPRSLSEDLPDRSKQKITIEHLVLII